MPRVCEKKKSPAAVVSASSSAVTIVVTVLLQVDIWLCIGYVSFDLKEPFWNGLMAGYLSDLFHLFEAVALGGDVILTTARGGEKASIPAKMFTRRIVVIVCSICSLF